ncbi:MAG TPA: hypothetical protein VGI83_05515 [Gemmatimonadales bacterium]|jgi:hypothetical protein
MVSFCKQGRAVASLAGRGTNTSHGPTVPHNSNNNIAERQAELTGYHDATAPATVVVATFDGAARWRRSIRGLLQCWGIAILCIFIPVAHFFLVPGFFIAGVVVFVRRRGQSVVVVSARGRCPDCSTEQAFDAPARWEPEFAVDCRQCHRRLRLTTISR